VVGSYIHCIFSRVPDSQKDSSRIAPNGRSGIRMKKSLFCTLLVLPLWPRADISCVVTDPHKGAISAATVSLIARDGDTGL